MLFNSALRYQKSHISKKCNETTRDFSEIVKPFLADKGSIVNSNIPWIIYRKIASNVKKLV